MLKDNLGDATAWGVASRWAMRCLAGLLVVACALYLLRHSDFNNDDLDNFLAQGHGGLWHFLFVPIDIHYAPFHRLLTWLVYRIDPMNFGVAVAVLMAFYVGSLICMSRTFALLHVGPAAGLIVCVYAASQLIIFGLSWWAHAEHRAPYVFLDLFAIYHYLAWLRTSSKRHVWLMMISAVIALGFYEKAVLIPFHMLAVGFLSDERRFRERFIQSISPLVPLFLASLIYVAAYLFFLPQSVGHKPVLTLRTELEFLRILYAAGMGLSTEAIHDVPFGELSIAQMVALCAWIVMLLWTAKSGRGGWKIVLAMALVPLVDNLPIALSNRVTLYGMVTHQYRYQYEELHVLAMLAGLWFARETTFHLGNLRGRAIWLCGFLATLMYAWLNHADVQASRAQFPSSLWFLDQSHGYMRNLRAGLASVKEQSPLFENDDLPRYLIICRITPDSQAMLPLFLPKVRFTYAAGPHFAVTPSGNVVMSDAVPSKGPSPGQGTICRAGS
jgi:hypothetical protein